MRRTQASIAAWKMCGRKRAYHHREDAERVLTAMEQPSARVYRCPICSRWHIGNGEGVGSR